ncbi:zf-TFIIB domain-containing protein [Agromyces atrinae]|uniref:TFIIB-type zinc ribbon-containing protein n=1 Tax=Agromyces atrinae TaxID=592376 RepID=UPI001F576AA5|nr:zf-TFIIB domain-containing protein [Agromyces atrinae]MCI2956211.1 zf-TFIIB domain-containing protein [Agromyces atrinae]
MQCPSDGTVLVMSERSGVEIDYCPTCRGVWLDRGELDKILDRAAQEFRPAAATPPPAAPMAPPMAPPAPAYGQQDDRYRDSRSRDRDDRYDSGYNNNGYNNSGYNNGYGKKKKRDNWLSELFD